MNVTINAAGYCFKAVHLTDPPPPAYAPSQPEIPSAAFDNNSLVCPLVFHVYEREEELAASCSLALVCLLLGSDSTAVGYMTCMYS